MEKLRGEKTYLGIELGSTRIKAVLIDETFSVLATGSYDWENRLENGYWTYSLEDVRRGLQACYGALKQEVKQKYGTVLTTVGALGVSGMMHGYLAFNAQDRLLVPFRTWRNTVTGQAAQKLTELFSFPIPQRWSIAHLYQAVLNNEPHVAQIAHINTLAGYVHFLLSGKRAVGAGEAAGMFPINGLEYDKTMLEKFSQEAARLGCPWNIAQLLPDIQPAGACAGYLTAEGARLLDAEGDLLPGVPLCPPEGDASTGMVATGSVLPGEGNVSAGTSIFAMLVLKEPLKAVYPALDIGATPEGRPAVMVHCNNCCGELDAWVEAFAQFGILMGAPRKKGELYEALYRHALEKGTPDCGGIVAYNYLSGEHITEVASGRPMYFRNPEGEFSLANFMRAQLYAAMAVLRIGMDILYNGEQVQAESFTAHGGLFKVEGAAQQLLADALKTPVSVLKTAGEGGAWGMALLAAYLKLGKQESLAAFLSQVFQNQPRHTLLPCTAGSEGFDAFMQRYRAGLAAEKAADCC